MGCSRCGSPTTRSTLCRNCALEKQAAERAVEGDHCVRCGAVLEGDSELCQVCQEIDERDEEDDDRDSGTPIPLPDGGRKSRRFVLGDHRHVSYGPAPADDYWTLTFTDDEVGCLEVLLDEHAMYELWIEVQDVPWPRGPSEAGSLRREIVHRTRGMDEEMLEEVLGCVEEAERR